MALAVILLSGDRHDGPQFPLRLLEFHWRPYRQPPHHAGVAARRQVSQTGRAGDFLSEPHSTLAALPGVDSVTSASALPGSSAMSEAYELEGAAPVDPKRRPVATYLTVDAGHFRLHASPLLGRAFTDVDGISGPPVVIVNRTFAARQWPHQDALGKRLRVYDSTACPPGSPSSASLPISRRRICST